jgi:hypothetical protein
LGTGLNSLLHELRQLVITNKLYLDGALAYTYIMNKRVNICLDVFPSVTVDQPAPFILIGGHIPEV